MGKRKRSTGYGGLFIIGLIVVLGAGALAYYMSGGLQRGILPPQQKPQVTVRPEPASVQSEEERKVVLYLPKESPGGLYLAPVPGKTSTKGDILEVALKMLLATNKQGGILEDLIPKSTRLLSPIRVKDGVAVVNLSKEFQDNFSGGSDQEALTLNSIVHTLVSNSDGKVSSVRILVEGETVETLGGHFELTDPVTADSTMLKPK